MYSILYLEIRLKKYQKNGPHLTGQFYGFQIEWADTYLAPAGAGATKALLIKINVLNQFHIVSLLEHGWLITYYRILDVIMHAYLTSKVI